jgi:hypothetical protein
VVEIKTKIADGKLYLLHVQFVAKEQIA